MPKPKNIVHALVLWGRTAEDKKNRDTRKTCDVIELSSIPRKFRREGAQPMLKWMDKKTKKASMNKATIVKISDDHEELQRMSSGMTGAISDSTEKLFGSDVHHKRKELQQARKKFKTANENFNETEIFENLPECVEEEENYDRDDPESKTQRFMNAMKEFASHVTEENIKFVESLVQVMKVSRLGEKKPELNSSTPFKIPDMYTTPGRGKVPIWEGINFYFYEVVKASIEAKSHVIDKSTGERLRHWPLLVRLALVEIYGKKLADHSAKGSKSGSRPAINHKLFRAVHYWASDWVGHEVDVDAYVEHINKTCYNKRKGMPHEIKKRLKKIPPKEIIQIEKSLLASSSGQQPIKNESTPMEFHEHQAQSVSNDVNSSQVNQFSSSDWDMNECNFANLL